MNKESIIELQKIDCNCNDCKFLDRNIARYNTVVACDYDSQYWFFRRKKARRILSARKKIQKAITLQDKEKYMIALQEAVAMEFHYFVQNAPIQYGECSKFNTELSFIPNTTQLETQQCFEHRRG
jgi:hypothetical protein